MSYAQKGPTYKKKVKNNHLFGIRNSKVPFVTVSKSSTTFVSKDQAPGCLLFVNKNLNAKSNKTIDFVKLILKYFLLSLIYVV